MTKVPRGALALAAVAVLFGLAAASVGGAVTDSQSQSTIVSDDNSTNYLSPTATSGEEYQRVTMDAAAATTVAAQEIHSAHDAESFERRLQSVESDRRTDVAGAQLETVKERFERLDRRQAVLFDEYSSGEISSATLLRELIALQAAVESQAALVDRAESDADPSADFRVELESLVDAISVEQPVTDRLQGSLVGSEEPTTVYLQSADGALVLALIDGDVHLRQATLLDERNLAEDDQFGEDLSPGGYSEAQQRMEALYPWAYNLPDLRIGGEDLSVYSQIYQLGLDHPQGELTVYFDGATKNVFHETQRLRLETLPIQRTVENSTEVGTLTVETTRATGAMRVTAEDAGGSGTDSTVLIDGQEVGTTGDDGVLWTIQPASEFEVTMTSPDGGNVSVDWSRES